MIVRNFLCSKTATLEEFAAQRKKMNGYFCGMAGIGLATLLFVTFLLPRWVEVNTEKMQFFSGVYIGIGAALMVCGLILLVKNRALLKAPEKCRRAWCEAGDERNREISTRATHAAAPVIMVALYLGMLVGGAFDMAIFWFCFGMIFLFAAVLLGFIVYYRNKL